MDDHDMNDDAEMVALRAMLERLERRLLAEDGRQGLARDAKHLRRGLMVRPGEAEERAQSLFAEAQAGRLDLNGVFAAYDAWWEEVEERDRLHRAS